MPALLLSVCCLGGFSSPKFVNPAFAEEIMLPNMSYDPVSSVDGGTRSSVSGAANSLSASESEKSFVYKIGPNDVLSIQVWQSPDLNREVTVRFDGRITFPLAGELVVDGMTVTDVANELSERLREFIRRPQVTVTVKEFHSQQILVLGNVSRTGIYPLKGPMKILELLTAAGMPLEGTSDITKITVIRASGEVLTINLEAFLYRREIAQNIYLKAGDNIFVPSKPAVTAEAAAAPKQFFAQKPDEGKDAPEIVEPTTSEIMVLGEVGQPGAYSFPRETELKVWQVLLKAGGVGSGASLRSVKVIRSDKIQEPVDLTKLIFDGDMSQNLPLFHGDVIYVPRRKSMRIYIIGGSSGVQGGAAGSVKGGVLDDLPATTDLLQLMARVSPDRWSTSLSNVKIIRGWPNSPKVLTANVNALIYQFKMEENIPLQDNDVIFFPQTFLANVLEVVNRVLAPVSGAITSTTEFGQDDDETSK